MTAQQLKNSILQMAVQGKLVPQDPNDEPASVLLERIRAEKEALIKAGKIKKEKNPSVIFRGADNIPYEKIGNAEPVPVEVPFDIPESWEWVRAKNIVNVVSARRVHKADWEMIGIPFYRAREIAALSDNGFVENELFITNELYNEFAESGVPKENDLMITAVGTLGKVYVVKSSDKFYYKDASVICFENFGKINPYYIKYVFESPFLRKNINESSSGTTVGTITIVKANEYLFPIPPIAEQTRIVAKIEELLPYIEKYAQAEKQLNELNSAFPIQLKKSILQLAVQGKLVSQDENDEPASVLLERIHEEKKALIKAGKLKKDKNESFIFVRDNVHYENVGGVERCIEDEIPFEIPESWEWCRIGSVFNLQAGKNISSSEIKDKPFSNSYLCYGGNGVRGYVSFYNHNGDYPIIGRQGALCGNINRATGVFYATEHAVCVDTFANTNVSWACILLKSLNLNQYATATAQPGLAVANIVNILIPLPPLNEQHRIAEKIEQLLPYTT